MKIGESINWKLKGLLGYSSPLSMGYMLNQILMEKIQVSVWNKTATVASIPIALKTRF